MMAKTVRDTERLSASHFRPVGVVSWIDSPLDLNFTLALYLLCFAAGIASLLGWKYRVSAPLHGLTLLWITTYRNSWGMVFHSENLWVMHTLILACLPAADAWSLDARRKLANPDPDLRYGWGLRLMATIAALTYVLAGGGQIAHSWRRMVERRCVVWPCRVGQPAKTRARSRTFAARCRAFELARSICTPRLAEHRSRIMRSDRTVRSATRVAVDDHDVVVSHRCGGTDGHRVSLSGQRDRIRAIVRGRAARAGARGPGSGSLRPRLSHARAGAAG